ncbi:MAG: DUF4215 domain-containing protein, partial [Candidatus Peribacteraceae bacterium]|nr:DUF4215 domain-containing protein [Candidatus Peribacteraceae bacterium]
MAPLKSHHAALLLVGILMTAVTMLSWRRETMSVLRGQTTSSASSASVVPRIAISSRHKLYLNSSGNVYAWGGNDSGQLGNGTTTISSVPVRVKGVGGTGYLSGITAIEGGNDYSVALGSNGNVYAWGHKYKIGCGDLANTISSVPLQVKGVGGTGYLSGITAISSGDLASFALDGSGNVYAWGNSSYIGVDDVAGGVSWVPVRVKGVDGAGYLSGITAIYTGPYRTYALDGNGNVYVWGTDNAVPVRVKGVGGQGYLTGIKAIAFSSDFTLALDNGGYVYAWGRNLYGALGDGTTVDSPYPVLVKGVGGAGNLSGISMIRAGSTHSLALDVSGNVYAWGPGPLLGQGWAIANYPTPVQVKGVGGAGSLTGIAAIALESDHSFALGNNGDVYAWGYNFKGEIGNGTASSNTVLTPERVKSADGQGYLSGIRDIQTNGAFSLVRSNNGTIYAWGEAADVSGGGFVNRSLPFQTVLCSDGFKDSAEGCDDGNANDGDGCTSSCAVESGWTCSGTFSVCTAICGSGIRVGSEQCDDDNTVAND